MAASASELASRLGIMTFRSRSWSTEVLPFLRIPEIYDKDVIVVDCPTCPVSLSCLTGRSGTGWRFDCCGTAIMAVRDGFVFVDCQINEFRDERASSDHGPCPLCTGGIMEAAELTRGNPAVAENYYLATVHAKFPLAERLANLRQRRQEALAWPGERRKASKMATYLSLYEDHLTKIIEHGGSEGAVETAISEYNKATPAKLEAWAKQAALACSYCTEPADIDGARPTDEVTCKEHRV